MYNFFYDNQCSSPVFNIRQHGSGSPKESDVKKVSRVKELQKKVFAILGKIEDDDKRAKAAAHLHGVSLAAVMIAKKRGEDPELAAMAGLLHDLHAYKSGSYDDHAHLGAEYARKLLEKLALTTEDETEIICSAIWHHDNKAETDGRGPEGCGCDRPLSERSNERNKGTREGAVFKAVRGVWD